MLIVKIKGTEYTRKKNLDLFFECSRNIKLKISYLSSIHLIFEKHMLQIYYKKIYEFPSLLNNIYKCGLV